MEPILDPTHLGEIRTSHDGRKLAEINQDDQRNAFGHSA
jgi:hypothetical protein